MQAVVNKGIGVLQNAKHAIKCIGILQIAKWRQPSATARDSLLPTALQIADTGNMPPPVTVFKIALAGNACMLTLPINHQRSALTCILLLTLSPLWLLQFHRLQLLHSNIDLYTVVRFTRFCRRPLPVAAILFYLQHFELVQKDQISKNHSCMLVARGSIQTYCT